MNNFAKALAAIERLKWDGVVTEYALGDAMALVFCAEPIPTFAIDIFVLLRCEGPLISLSPCTKGPGRADMPKKRSTS